jgi:hypothetical protein
MAWDSKNGDWFIPLSDDRLQKRGVHLVNAGGDLSLARDGRPGEDSHIAQRPWRQ